MRGSPRHERKNPQRVRQAPGWAPGPARGRRVGRPARRRPPARRRRPPSIAAWNPAMNAVAAASLATGPAARPMGRSWPPSARSPRRAACARSAPGTPCTNSSRRAAMRTLATALSTAIPSAPPTCRAVLSTPDATPALSASMAFMAVALTVGMASAAPAPHSTNRGQIDEYALSASDGPCRPARRRAAASGRRRCPRADGARQAAGKRRDEEDHPRPGQRPDTRLQRRIALDVLQVERGVEDRAEHREATSPMTASDALNSRRAKKPSGSIGSGARRSHTMKAASSTSPAARKPST